MKPIYFLFTKTTTALSRMIGLVTSEDYTHVSISLNEDLSSLYSFARLYPNRPLPAGFVIETPDTGYLGLHPDTACTVYKLMIPNSAYKKIQKKLSAMQEHQHEYHYSILGTIYCMFSIKHKRPNHYFCSQFIGELLSESGAVKLPKHESLMHPVDYMKVPGCQPIYHGTIHGLNTFFVQNRLSMIS